MQLTLAMDKGSITIHVAACTRAQFSRNPTMCLTQASEVKSKWRCSLEDSSKGQSDTDGGISTSSAVLVPTRYSHHSHDGDSMFCLAQECEANGKSGKSHSDKDIGKLDKGYNRDMAVEIVMAHVAVATVALMSAS